MGISNQVKLSQWDALMVESLRALGWSNEELISRVKQGDLPVDESAFQFDYKALADYAAAQPEEFEAAVTKGYQIKYNTVRGIRSWIFVKYGKEPELVLDEGQEAVHAALTLEEKAQLESVLSFGWSVLGEQQASAEETSVYRIEPIQR